MVYDVNEERVNKVLKLGRKYLNWMQNSVLEGEISESKFIKLKIELKRTIEEEEDSIIFYKLRTTKFFDRETMGKQKAVDEKIL